MINYLTRCFNSNKIYTLILLSFVLILIYFKTENIIINISLYRVESFTRELYFQNKFKNFQSKKKCDSIYLNLYKLHSTIGSQYPKQNYSQYKSDLYKSFNRDRLDNAQIKNAWLVDSDFYDIKNETNEALKYISNKHIVEVMEFISMADYYNSLYVDHQKLFLMLRKYLNLNEISRKNIALIGLYERDYVPWIETFLFMMSNQLKLRIIDHKPKHYENFNFEWTSMTKYLREKYTKSIITNSLVNEYQDYDIIISHHMIDRVNF
jgi:hypothetical protein